MSLAGRPKTCSNEAMRLGSWVAFIACDSGIAWASGMNRACWDVQPTVTPQGPSHWALFGSMFAVREDL